MKDPEIHILDSWHDNAEAWVQAISKGEIESRIKITNQAVINAVDKVAGHRILDIGCGEGWLSKQLGEMGYHVTGIDAVTELIATAKYNDSQHHCRFEVCSYRNISRLKSNESYDTVVCNFSLLGDRSTQDVLKNLEGLLSSEAHLVIQTLHPENFPELNTGWQPGSWQGFNSKFSNPPPWFFRTVEDCRNLMSKYDYSIIEQITPRAPGESRPASLIFIGCKK